MTADFREYLDGQITDLTSNMEKRGGGVTGLYFKDFDKELSGVRQLIMEFETCDSMGANFINSALEQFAQTLQMAMPSIEIVMSILSNYTPSCKVKATVQCDIEFVGIIMVQVDSFITTIPDDIVCDKTLACSMHIHTFSCIQNCVA